MSPSSSAAGPAVDPFAAAAGGGDVSRNLTLEPALLERLDVEGESSSPAAGAEPPTASGPPSASGPEEVDEVLEVVEGGGGEEEDVDEWWRSPTE